MRFALRRDLDDPALDWIRWKDDRFVRWAPPPIGATVLLPPIDLSRAMHP